MLPRTCSAKYQMFNHWQILTHWSRFTFTSWQNSNQLTPNLAILTLQNVWLFQMFTKKPNTIPNSTLEGDTPRGRAWETIENWFSRNCYQIMDLDAVPRSSELLGRGMMWWRRVQTEPGHGEHKIRITSFHRWRDLAAPRYKQNPWRRNRGSKPGLLERQNVHNSLDLRKSLRDL